jgi:hypothetical protein
VWTVIDALKSWSIAVYGDPIKGTLLAYWLSGAVFYVVTYAAVLLALVFLEATAPAQIKKRSRDLDGIWDKFEAHCFEEGRWEWWIGLVAVVIVGSVLLATVLFFPLWLWTIIWQSHYGISGPHFNDSTLPGLLLRLIGGGAGLAGVVLVLGLCAFGGTAAWVFFSELRWQTVYKFVLTHWRWGKLVGVALVGLALFLYLTTALDPFSWLLGAAGVCIFAAWLATSTLVFLWRMLGPGGTGTGRPSSATNTTKTKKPAAPKEPIASRQERREAKEETAKHLRKHGR